MLTHRLVFGALMTASFAGVAICDGWLDGSLTASVADDSPIQGTLLCIVVSILIVPAQLELGRLARAKGIRIFAPVSIAGSILFASSWYWMPFIEISPAICLFLLSAFCLVGLLVYQYVCCGTSGVLANCGASWFSVFYVGALSGFVLGLRIDFGLWPMLMSVFAVKSSDIGAYAGGKLLGRHKFAPKISPAKTWEGMCGAIAAAMIVSILFATGCDIMPWRLAAIFGCGAAFIGQMGDLAESMIKRDAQQKDSAKSVPGFGGILDIIDSPLAVAPFAYLFFLLTVGCRIC
jgi:phosphatidate cytidylyltransferase